VRVFALRTFRARVGAGRPKRRPAIVWLGAGLGVGALAIACAGHSQALPPESSPSQLDCLVTLQSECCEASGAPTTCVATFTAAEECASWDGSASVVVFPVPCQGLRAVRETRPGITYTTFYVYDASGALYAIGDNATSPDPQAPAGPIECGAGPSGWVVPSACTNVWLGSSGSRCGGGTAGATSICAR
jgi:hypothetical protein